MVDLNSMDKKWELKCQKVTAASAGLKKFAGVEICRFCSYHFRRLTHTGPDFTACLTLIGTDVLVGVMGRGILVGAGMQVKHNQLS